MRLPTELERMFDGLSRMLLPGIEWQHEVRFAPPRLWRFDRVCGSVVVEIEGRGHNRELNFANDIIKYNCAAEMGYVLFRCTNQMLTNDPDSFFDQLRRTIERRRA